MPSLHHWIASCTASVFSFCGNSLQSYVCCLQQLCVFTLLCSNVAMDNRHLMIFPSKILKPPRKTGDFPSPGWIRGDFPKSSQPQALRYRDERLRRGAGDVFLWSLRKPRTPRRAATGEHGSISDGLHGTSHWDDENRS